MNQIQFYGTKLYYEEQGELVCWRTENDFCNRLNTKELFSKFLEYEYQDVDTLTVEEFKKTKREKIWNKEGKYLGLEKSTGRLMYYTKIEYEIIRDKGWKCPAVFYLPKLDLELLEWVADCKSKEGMNYAIANIIYKNCNNYKVEMDIDTLAWIVEKYRNR